MYSRSVQQDRVSGVVRLAQRTAAESTALAMQYGNPRWLIPGDTADIGGNIVRMIVPSAPGTMTFPDSGSAQTWLAQAQASWQSNWISGNRYQVGAAAANPMGGMLWRSPAGYGYVSGGVAPPNLEAADLILTYVLTAPPFPTKIVISTPAIPAAAAAPAPPPPPSPISGPAGPQPGPTPLPTSVAATTVYTPPASLPTPGYAPMTGSVVGDQHGNTWTWSGTSWQLSKIGTGAPATGEQMADQVGNVYAWDGAKWTLAFAAPQPQVTTGIPGAAAGGAGAPVVTGSMPLPGMPLVTPGTGGVAPGEPSSAAVPAGSLLAAAAPGGALVSPMWLLAAGAVGIGVIAMASRKKTGGRRSGRSRRK